MSVHRNFPDARKRSSRTRSTLTLVWNLGRKKKLISIKNTSFTNEFGMVKKCRRSNMIFGYKHHCFAWFDQFGQIFENDRCVKAHLKSQTHAKEKYQ